MTDPATVEPMAAPCARCGQVHAGCAGHVEECTACGATEGGLFEREPCPHCGGVVKVRPCKLPPMDGLTVCHSHGGATQRSRGAAARRLEERRLAVELGQALSQLQAEVAERGPEAVLLDQVWRAWAMAALLEVKVAESGEGELDGDVGRELREWTREAARLSKLALDAGFEERRIELAEGQAQQLAAVLRAGMAGLLTVVAEVLERVAPEVAGAELRGLEAAVPPVLREAIVSAGLTPGAGDGEDR